VPPLGDGTTSLIILLDSLSLTFATNSLIVFMRVRGRRQIFGIAARRQKINLTVLLGNLVVRRYFSGDISVKLAYQNQAGLKLIQQVMSLIQTKSVPKIERFCILNHIMVRHIDLSWNTLEASLLLMHEKLTGMGWVYYD